MPITNTRSIKNRERYNYRKERGFCVVCGWRGAREQRTKCERCSIIDNNKPRKTKMYKRQVIKK